MKQPNANMPAAQPTSKMPIFGGPGMKKGAPPTPTPRMMPSNPSVPSQVPLPPSSASPITTAMMNAMPQDVATPPMAKPPRMRQGMKAANMPARQNEPRMPHPTHAMRDTKGRLMPGAGFKPPTVTKPPVRGTKRGM